MTPPVAPAAPSTGRLVECHYCGKFTRELMNHGPGRCRPPLDQDKP